jgi:hypothetical protein
MSFKEAFAARHPLLANCWVTMDGLKLFLQQSRNAIVQEHYYTVGRTTTTSRPYFAFVQTGQLQLLSLTYQSQFTTVGLRSMGIFNENWKIFFF